MTPHPSGITRRDAIQRLSVLLGGAVSATSVSALLSGCRAAPAPTGWQPRVLTGAQFDALAVLVDRILPGTDTPGAAEVGVPAFVDTLLARWAEAAERERFLTGLDALVARTLGSEAVPFTEASEEEQVALLTELDREAARAREDGVDPLPFFAVLKEWTLVGYYTSEIGATVELRWLPAPGRYDANVSVEEVGRTWA